MKILLSKLIIVSPLLFSAISTCSCSRENTITQKQPYIQDTTSTPTTPTPTPIDSSIDQKPHLDSDTGLNYTLTIAFDTDSKGIKTSIPLLKYNKKKCISINFDDGNTAALKTLDKFQSLFYTDGCGNKIAYSADAAINGRHGSDNRELGATPNNGVLYSDMEMLISKNWDIANHGYYHNDGSDPVQDVYTNGKDAMKNIRDLDNLILQKLKYKMNCVVVPTNFYGYMLSGEAFGYIAGTSSNTFDNIKEPQMWDGWRHPKRLSTYSGAGFTVIQREFAENQWKPTEDYTWSGLQSTVKETEPCMQNFGTHGMNASEEAYFRQWMDLISSMGDEVMMTSMREFFEYEHLRRYITKTESTEGQQLKVEIDYSKVPNKNISWKDLSFVVSGSANIKSVTCSNSTYKVTYNPTTRLINVLKRQVKW